VGLGLPNVGPSLRPALGVCKGGEVVLGARRCVGGPPGTLPLAPSTEADSRPSNAGDPRGPHVRAIADNIVHTWFVGGLAFVVGLWLSIVPVALAGAILVAHTGMDRVQGYGLKHTTAFADTHRGASAERDGSAAGSRAR
jgi:hypothetical protein